VRSSFLRNFIDLVCDDYSFPLGRCCRLSYPEFVLILLHFSLQVNELIRQEESFGNEVEMLLAVHFSHARHLFVHQVFPRDVEGLREVVYLLILGEGLIDCVFQG